MSRSKSASTRNRKRVEVRDLKKIDARSADPKGGAIVMVNGGGNTPNGSYIEQDNLYKKGS